MNDKGFYIKKLIEKLAHKIETDLSWKGFELMAETIEVNPRYLKYDLYEGKSKSKPRLANLELIAKKAGYKSYKEFCRELDKEDDPVLQSVIGNYYSYIRMNHEEANLLRSPVKITMSDGQILYHQKGGRFEFNGRLHKHEGCLFVLMESSEGKSFYHVYRIGKRSSPEVLQGIFSGVSTDFIPIGGRAVLVRTEKSFDTLETGILDIKKMLKSKREDESTLARYFENREENNLSIKRPANFSLRDLRGR